MQISYAGAARVGGSSFNAFGYIERHPSNIVTSASFTPPPRKSLLERLVEFLRSEGRP